MRPRTTLNRSKPHAATFLWLNTPPRPSLPKRRAERNMKSHKNKVRKSHRTNRSTMLFAKPTIPEPEPKNTPAEKGEEGPKEKRGELELALTRQTCRTWRCPWECVRVPRLYFLCLHTLKQFLGKLCERQNFVHLSKALLLAQGTLHGGCGQSMRHYHSVSPLPLICGKRPSLVVLRLPLDSRAEKFPDILSGGHLVPEVWETPHSFLSLPLPPSPIQT